MVSDVTGEDAARLVDSAAERGDHAAPLGWTLQPVREGDRLVDERADVGALTPDTTLRWLDLRAGRFPSGPDEAVADVNAAKADRIEIGDRLRVGTGTRAATVTVVGLADTPSAMVAAGALPPLADRRALVRRASTS